MRQEPLALFQGGKARANRSQGEEAEVEHKMCSSANPKVPTLPTTDSLVPDAEELICSIGEQAFVQHQAALALIKQTET